MVLYYQDGFQDDFPLFTRLLMIVSAKVNLLKAW